MVSPAKINQALSIKATLNDTFCVMNRVNYFQPCSVEANRSTYANQDSNPCVSLRLTGHVIHALAPCQVSNFSLERQKRLWSELRFSCQRGFGFRRLSWAAQWHTEIHPTHSQHNHPIFIAGSGVFLSPFDNNLAQIPGAHDLSSIFVFFLFVSSKKSSVICLRSVLSQQASRGPPSYVQRPNSKRARLQWKCASKSWPCYLINLTSTKSDPALSPTGIAEFPALIQPAFHFSLAQAVVNSGASSRWSECTSSRAYLSDSLGKSFHKGLGDCTLANQAVVSNLTTVAVFSYLCVTLGQFPWSGSGYGNLYHHQAAS